MKKILISGGTRYLGKVVTSILSEKNKDYEVATLSRTKNQHLNIKHFICDRKEIESLAYVFNEFKPNIILDMINFSEDDSKGMVKLFEKGILSELEHYISISSFFVYNYFNVSEFSEKKLNTNKNLTYTDDYTLHKVKSEIALYSSPLMEFTSILRLPFIFSADDYSNRFQNACEFAINEKKNKLDNKFKFSLIRKKTAADSIINILNHAPLGITDIANNGCVTSEELCLILSDDQINKTSFRKDSILNFPYFVEKDICLNTNKIILNESISEALRKEAEIYFSEFKKA